MIAGTDDPVIPDNLKNYKLWLRRFARVLQLVHVHPNAPLEALQLFLLDAGQYNANFILEELNRLNYPHFPFTIMHRHTYLRSTDTWAMEMLRRHYMSQPGKSKSYPFWVDSAFIWPELKRYCGLIDYVEPTNCAAEIVQQYNSNFDHAETPIWIRLSQLQVDNFEKIKTDVLNKIKSHLLQFVFNKKQLPPSLFNLFEIIAHNENETNFSELDKSQVEFLDKLFPQVIETRHKEANEFTYPNDLEYADNIWFKKVIGKANKHKIKLPDNIKNEKDLKKYSISNSDEFKTLLILIQTAVRDAIPKANTYKPYISSWLLEKVSEPAREISKNIIYCYHTLFNNVDGIILLDHSTFNDDAKTVIDNLGYRIDPIKIIRVILTQYPKLFFDKNDTERFLNMYISIVESQLKDKNPHYQVLLKELQIIKEIKAYIISALTSKVEEIPDDTEDKENAVDDNESDSSNGENDDESSEEDDDEVPGNYNVDSELRYFNMKASARGLPPAGILWIFVKIYLRDYYKYPQNYIVRIICDPEIKIILRNLNRLSADDIVKNLKYIQLLADIMLFDLSLSRNLVEIQTLISKSYLQQYPVRAVLLTPYAMRAYVRVFQAMEVVYRDRVIKVTVTNQSYFEWLKNLERIDPQRVSVSRIQHLSDIDSDSDILFLEFHPNNVVEARQFQHNASGLLSKMESWPKKPRTIVIDATLNAINDKEILAFLHKAKELVNSGYLNIMFLQSLTKFYQVGLDRRSAGALIVINDGDNWLDLNKKLNELQSIEPIDYSTLNYFSYLYNFPNVHIEYIHLINSNVSLLYNKTIEKMNRLSVLRNNRMQITVSSDGGACYIALNLNQFLADMDPNFELEVHEIDHFIADLLHYLIIPLCHAFNLPLTERTSIGFPLSSVNAVYTSLRFTIGLESVEELDDYAEVLTFASFVMNNQEDLDLFIDKSDNSSLRKRFFSEKVNQFVSMTARLKRNYSYYYTPSGKVYSAIEYYTIPRAQEENYVELNMSNGDAGITKTLPLGQSGKSYRGYKIYVMTSDEETILLSEMDRDLRILAISLISGYSSRNRKSTFFTKLHFDEQNRRVVLDCRKEFSQVHTYTVFGPFFVQPDLPVRPIPIYFYRKEWYLFCYLLGQAHQLNREGILLSLVDDVAFTRQGHVITPLSCIPIDEWDYLFREGPYSQPTLIQVPRAFKFVDKQYVPDTNDPTQFSICYQDGKLKELVIERDFLCVSNAQGISIYKRYMGLNLTCYEVDFWSEKNPLHARFLRLIIAILVKESSKSTIQFSAYNHFYSRFLFNLSFDNSDFLFTESIQKLLKHRKNLINLLDSQVCESDDKKIKNIASRYNFDSRHEIVWPSGMMGISSIGNSKLIADVLEIVAGKGLNIATELSPVTTNAPERKLPSQESKNPSELVPTTADSFEQDATRFITFLMLKDERLYPDIIGKLRNTVHNFCENIHYLLTSEMRQLVLLHEIYRRRLEINVKHDENPALNALEVNQSIIILSELDFTTNGIEGGATQLNDILRKYASSEFPIYICVNVNKLHFTTLVVLPRVSGDNSCIFYRYIDPLYDNTGDWIGLPDTVIDSFTCTLKQHASEVVAFNIPYLRQQSYANQRVNIVGINHNNECAIHNVFNVLFMLQHGIRENIADMRNFIPHDLLYGPNISRNGSIDSDDAEEYIRPYYQKLFRYILQQHHTPKAAISTAESIDSQKPKAPPPSKVAASPPPVTDSSHFRYFKPDPDDEAKREALNEVKKARSKRIEEEEDEIDAIQNSYP